MPSPYLAPPLIGSADVAPDKAALLCGHHHTTVHTRRLAGTLAGGRVEWDTTRSSYDTHLTTRHTPPTQPDRP